MIVRRFIPQIALLLVGCILAAADSKAGTGPKPMTKETRLLVIRSLQSEFVFARRALPQGNKGVVLKDGRIVSPDDREMEMLLATWGPAAKPGDRVQITKIDIRDKKILFEINGGPKKKSKWYQHVQVGVNGRMAQAPDEDTHNAKGSVIELDFDRFVPEMTGDQLREQLGVVFNFKAQSAAEAYLETVPPKVKDAIKNHQVLVGMNREMVNYAVGRPERKIREQDEKGREYEEWMYGQPPREVQFVRFVGDEVVQLKIMKVDGEKVVRTDREVELPKVAEKKPEAKAEPPAFKKPPTLKRPGESTDPQPQGGAGTTIPGSAPMPEPPPTNSPSQLPPG